MQETVSQTETNAEPINDNPEEDTAYITPEEDALQIEDALREMFVGIIGMAVLALIVFLIAGGENRLSLILGLTLGTAASGVILWHMYVTIGRAVDMDADSATKYTRKKAIVRMLAWGAVLVISALFPAMFHVVGTLVGLFLLKFTAYLQPLTHKALKSINKGR